MFKRNFGLGINLVKRAVGAAAIEDRFSRVAGINAPWSDNMMLRNRPNIADLRSPVSAITPHDPIFAKQNEISVKLSRIGEVRDEEGWDSGSDEEEEKIVSNDTKTKKKLLVIGNGNMSGGVLRGILADPELMKEYDITVVSPRIPWPDKALPGVRYVTPEELAAETEKFDIITLGIKPQKVQEVLPFYGNKLKEDGVVLSLMAGVKCKTIASFFPEGAAVVRSMPNLAAMVGESMTGLFANEFATEENIKDIDRIACSFGSGIWVRDEDSINRITASSGSLIGHALRIMSTIERGLHEVLGFTKEESEIIVPKIFLGAIALKRKDPLGLASAIVSIDKLLGEAYAEKVESPNGTTLEGRKHLERLCVINDDLVIQLKNIFEDMLIATYERANELATAADGKPLTEDKKPEIKYLKEVIEFMDAKLKKEKEKKEGITSPDSNPSGVSGKVVVANTAGPNTPGC